jgi:uracil-DNA glycosylase
MTQRSDSNDSLEKVCADISNCRACPRLVEWRETIAAEKRASFRDDEYWGRGVPGFGDPKAKLWVMGLAPAAHGANRTGRMFTGDRSGDWLYRAMHRAKFATQAESTWRDDGLQLKGAWVSSAVRCAPPDNKPNPDERDACRTYVVCKEWGVKPRPKFGHGVEVVAPDGTVILCSFHPSQQNTFTGKLTEPMFDAVFSRARELCSAKR